MCPKNSGLYNISARAQTPWEQNVICDWLKTRLSDYPIVQLHNEYRAAIGIDPQNPKQIKHECHDLALKGLRCHSADKLHVAQFNRDGFVFSRLQPYMSWHELYGEGMRLWRLYCELAKPSEVHRLALRFINRIMIPPQGQLEDYLRISPQPPSGLNLPLAAFLHNDTFDVPGPHPYAIHLIRAIPPQIPKEDRIGLFVDISVWTKQPYGIEGHVLEQRLNEMRWLKNKAFFGSITENALEKFRCSSQK